MSALRFDGVTARLAGRDVLRGVDLEVRSGEVLGLLGRNGAGKTTLLRVATAVLPAGAGSVLVNGAGVSELSRRELARRLAVVPQETHVPFPFRVSEVVLMGRTPHQGAFGFDAPEDLARAQAALERMGVAQLADRSILEISGGERQLVMVARALAQEPDVLLFDEPTAFLDLGHRLDVLGVLREVAADGRAALVVSHDLTLAARFCDRLALLADGRIAASGSAADVLTPEHLRAAFGIEADVVPGPDGAPLVLPRL